MNQPRFAALLLASMLSVAVGAQESKVINDFEAAGDLRMFEIKQKSGALSDQHATHGKQSLKIAANEHLYSDRFPKDWSAYDALEMDVFVEGDVMVLGSLLIGDTAWQKSGGSYWNRHNGAFNLRPGANTVSIPVNGLFRGEAGSRNNDIKTNIDPKSIIRVDFDFRTKQPAPTAALYVDNLRFTKESRPAGILAFDMGPASQMVAPGFTAIAPGTVYGKNGNKAGMNFAGTDGQARDDTFPTRLYRDCILMDGFVFIVDVPERVGKYHAWVMYDDLGYWGGEAAPYKKRSILANNVVAFSEDRGEAGPTDFLYRFEKTEPHPGDGIWDLYMKELFKPRRFECQSDGGVIKLKFTADAGMSCKVAAIILYPDSIKEEAEKWIEQVEARNRAEFESRAIFLGPKAKQLDVPAEAQSKGYWVGYPGLEEEVSFADAPGVADGKLARPAARGQRISYTFAVRPVRDLGGPVQLTVGDLNSDNGGTIPAAEVDLRYVHHGTHRTYNDIAYSIGPDTIRPVAGADLRLWKDLTRQFWITVHVPDGAAAGSYCTEVVLTAGDVKVALPLSVQVLPYALDEPEFAMGFFGTEIPRAVLAARGDDAWRELFTTLRQYGMNSFSGGPNIRFEGLDASGKPILDYGIVDRFMKLAREAGFTKGLDGYGGPGLVYGLHEAHAVGEIGRAWEKKTGKPFGEILKVTWAAVRDHAKENNWLPTSVSLIDEPRVLDQARQNVELIKLYREYAPWVNVGGSYSVDWKKDDPFETAVKELFKASKWNSLNNHTQADLDKAKEYGSEVRIYNQGRSRYSFGAYQWAEMRKGITLRMQWHLLALHGYQFFDLDGREPDTAAVNWTSHGIVPGMMLPRCREGADDLRFAATLWNLAQKNKESAAGKDAIAWLEDVSKQIPVAARVRPDGFMDDETFRRTCITKIGALTGGR